MRFLFMPALPVFIAATLLVNFSAHSETLPLKHVILSSSGLALYGHEGKVKGETNLELPVRLDRVDDLLKSLIVIQPPGGRLESVSLPGRKPLSRIFRDLPFDREDISDYPALLNALRGASISIDDGFITGRLMGANKEALETEEGIITRHRINVSTEEGIKTALLEEVTSLKFTENEMQSQLEKALESVFQNRVQDQRTLKIKTSGPERSVELVYIHDAPLWKSAYRLVLPEKDDGTATLQGWAILENTTVHDWKDITLTLMSGSPVTYHQALYESYYTDRPELPVKIMERVMPRVDKGSIAGPEKKEIQYPRRAPDITLGASNARKSKIAEAPPMPQAEKMAMSPMSDSVLLQETEPKELAEIQAASASETASQMVFRFPHKIDLPAGNTLMAPFSDENLSAERIYLYQPDTNSRHPLASVEINNDSGSALPSGIVTIYDNSSGQVLHVGDAEMPLVPKGETRFISFALDTGKLIDKVQSRDRELGMITISEGSLLQKVLMLSTTSYTIKAPEEENRTIIIEHPRRPEWNLVRPEGMAGDVGKTGNHYRLRFRLDKGETREIKITLQREITESMAVSSISPREIDRRLAAVSGRNIPRNVRKALESILDLRSATYKLEQELQRIDQKRRQIFNDQRRIRENLGRVSQGTSLGRRYLSQMEEQEDLLENLADREKEVREDLAKARKELDEYISDLRL